MDSLFLIGIIVRNMRLLQSITFLKAYDGRCTFTDVIMEIRALQRYVAEG